MHDEHVIVGLFSRLIEHLSNRKGSGTLNLVAGYIYVAAIYLIFGLAGISGVPSWLHSRIIVEYDRTEARFRMLLDARWTHVIFVTFDQLTAACVDVPAYPRLQLC